MESVSIKAAGGVKRRFLEVISVETWHFYDTRGLTASEIFTWFPLGLSSLSPEETKQNKTNPHNSDKSAGFSSAALISLRYISGITRCSRFMAPSTCGDQSDSADNCWVWVVIKWTTKVPWFITRRLGLTSSGELSGKGRGGETREAVQECRSNRCQGRCFHSLQL